MVTGLNTAKVPPTSRRIPAVWVDPQVELATVHHKMDEPHTSKDQRYIHLCIKIHINIYVRACVCVCVLYICMWLGFSIDIQNKTSYTRFWLSRIIHPRSLTYSSGNHLVENRWFRTLPLDQQSRLVIFGTYNHPNLSDISHITFCHTYKYQLLNSRLQKTATYRSISILLGSN